MEKKHWNAHDKQFVMMKENAAKVVFVIVLLLGNFIANAQNVT